ncbi:hypothetical protein WN55_06474 [Dufourea novaeangliae]|uniref:Uncharacterized protein n=1 Tax=Dufourea novaeangliae TaxID=178035 RepID=A0A154PQ79_DUFNO|nr:hypothetical protein WN55_06474 [Dufourea novaeangliae]
MNGPNESREPIKDYSRLVDDAPAPVSADRESKNKLRLLHASLTFATSHLIGTTKYTFPFGCSVNFHRTHSDPALTSSWGRSNSNSCDTRLTVVSLLCGVNHTIASSDNFFFSYGEC